MILTKSQFLQLRSNLELPVCFTNGCFDIFHAGHASFFEKLGHMVYDPTGQTHFVVVAVNSDESVKRLKGSDRPINTLADRMKVIDIIRPVCFVIEFDELRCDKLIEAIRPELYVKSGEYDSLDKLDSLERQALEKVGTRTKFIAPIPGISTTKICERLSPVNSQDREHMVQAAG